MADGFRIAFCIECHKYTPVLQELCRQLQHPEADIFIHVDAKSDIRDFAPLRPLARFIHPRSKVYWGEYGQIDCMLKLLRATCNEMCIRDRGRTERRAASPRRAG